MGDVKRSDSNIAVQDIPDNWSREQIVAFLDQLESTGKPFQGSYADAVKVISSANAPSGQVPAAQLPAQQTPANVFSTDIPSPSARQNQGAVPDANLMPQDAAQKTTFKGLIDAATREMGPTAAAAGTGFALTGGNPLGAAGGVLAYNVSKLLTPKLTQMLNEKFGTDQISMGEIEGMVMDSLGLEKPDTTTERIVSGAARGATEAGNLLLSGQTLASGAPTLGPGSVLQESGKVLTTGAGSQLAGEVGAGAGAQGGVEIAEEQDLGPIATGLLAFGGGILGDLTGTQLMNAAKNVQKRMIARKMDMPEAIQSILDDADRLGIPIYREDFLPATRNMADARTAREFAPGGVRTNRFEVQNPARQRATRQLAADFGVDLDDTSEVSRTVQSVADDFFDKRNADLTQFTGMRDEVLDKLSEGGAQVPMTNTMKYLDEQLANIERIGDVANNRLDKTLRDWQARYSGDSGDLSLSTLEELRSNLGEHFRGADGISSREQKVVNEMYRAVREDMADFIKKNGDDMDFAQWDDAMKGLSNLAEDFNTQGLRQIMQNKDAPIGAMGEALFNSEPDVLENVYTRLGPEGQARAREAFMTKMLSDATPGTPDSLSPNAATAFLKDSADKYRVLFPEQDAQHIDGLVKMLERTSRAEVEGLIKEVGILEGVPGASYGLARAIFKNPAVGIPAALGAMAARGKLRGLLENPAFRGALIKYDQIPSGATATTASDAAKALKEEAIKTMGRILRQSLLAMNTQEERLEQRSEEQVSAPAGKAPEVLSSMPMDAPTASQFAANRAELPEPRTLSR